MDVLELDHQLNKMIVEGKSADAFVRARQEMEKNIRKFEARVLAHAADGDTSFSEWDYTIELTGMGTMKIAQVAVRRWKNGRVVRERFYHK